MRDSTTHTPRVIATWSFGPVATGRAWPMIASGAGALESVVEGATAVEEDAAVDSVGLGGLPDASGRVSLDACVMEGPGRVGSVCFLRGYVHAAKIARAVMDKTIHVMLAGQGAEEFAHRHGFQRHEAEVLTKEAKAAWEQWRSARGQKLWAEREGVLPPMNVEERYKISSGGSVGGPADGAREGNHDTVCVLGLDVRGHLAGAVTTSGLGFKVPGRVGDSPIVGHGLYVQQGVGAAAATGNGELIMGVCGSFLCVEELSRGATPAQAVRAVLERIMRSYTLAPDHQVGMMCINAKGQFASASLRQGFSIAVADKDGNRSEPGEVMLRG